MRLSAEQNSECSVCDTRDKGDNDSDGKVDNFIKSECNCKDRLR